MSAQEAALVHLILSLPLTDATDVARQIDDYFRCSLEASSFLDRTKVTSGGPWEASYEVYLPPQATAAPVFSAASSYFKGTFKNTAIY